MDPNKDKLLASAVEEKPERTKAEGKEMIRKALSAFAENISISVRIKRAKDMAELNEVVDLTMRARYASDKTRRRWGHLIERKNKELSK